jgi:hypothetical protein
LTHLDHKFTIDHDPALGDKALRRSARTDARSGDAHVKPFPRRIFQPNNR